jgi:hypothetical protein
MTPLDWIKYVHRLPQDEIGEKLERRTRKACCNQFNVASICLLGLAQFSKPTTLADVKKVVDYQITPASFDRLVKNGLADLVRGDFRTWKLNAKGLEVANEIEANLKELIKKMTKK